MKNKYVIDSNIFIKIIIDEKDSPLAKGLFLYGLQKEVVLLVPSFFAYEILHIAQKKGYSIEAIREHLCKNKQIQITGLSDKLMDKSLELTEKTSHPKSGFPSVYDASCHALAILTATFITAEEDITNQ